MILTVVFVVLMMFWLFFGGYYIWDPQKPAMFGNVLIPWLCVAILGYMIFSGSPPPPLR